MTKQHSTILATVAILAAAMMLPKTAEAGSRSFGVAKPPSAAATLVPRQQTAAFVWRAPKTRPHAEKPEKLPDWIKSNARWWGSGEND